jgi:hypothetical protein
MSTIEPTNEAGYTGITPESKNATAEINNSKKINTVSEVVDAQSAAQANNESMSIEQVALTSKQLEQVAQQLQDFVCEMNRCLEF